MAFPVGSTTATFMVSIVAFGGCGYWWQCSDDRQDTPTYHTSKADDAIDRHTEYVAGETYHADDINLKEKVKKVTHEMALGTQRDTSDEAEMVDSIHAESSIFKMAGHVDDMILEANTKRETLEMTLYTQRDTSDGADMTNAMNASDSPISEIVCRADDMRLEENVEKLTLGTPLDTQRDDSDEAIMVDTITDGRAEPISDLAYLANGMSSKDNVKAVVDIALDTPQQNSDVNMFASHSSALSDDSQSALSIQGNLADRVVASKYPSSISDLGAPSWFTHTLILGFLCDAAVMVLTVMCCIHQKRKKQIIGNSEYDEASPNRSHELPEGTTTAATTVAAATTTAATTVAAATTTAATTVAAATTTAQAHVVATISAPSFVKAKQPQFDEPLADIHTDIDEMQQPENDVELQSRINMIVQSRKEQTMCDVKIAADEALNAAKQRQLQRSASKWDTPWSTSKEMASPSPAKSLSNIEIKYIAHMTLSAAKERNTPAKSPYQDLVAPCSLHWDAYDESMSAVPCISQNLQSMFDDDVEQGQTLANEESEARLEETAEKPCDANQSRDDATKSSLQVQTSEKEEVKSSLEVQTSEKEEVIGFDVTQIPSPCRKRSWARTVHDKSADLTFGGDSSQTNGEVMGDEKCTLAASPSAVAQDISWKPQDSPNVSAKQQSNWSSRYQCSPQSGTPSKLRAWQTPNSGTKDKGCTPSREHKLALRRAAALNAWGVASPDGSDFAFQ